MTTESHPDPIAEGFVHTGQRIAQLAAMAAVTRQLLVMVRERRNRAQQVRALEQQRRLENAERAAFEGARSRWAPVHDPAWLRNADLLQTARAWSAALPYATDNAAAASAVRKCEERLRQLHPHGMDHYDRFREAGLAAEEAMREAAPFFTRDPNVRTGQPADTPELAEGTGAWWAANEHGPLRSEWEEHRQVQRAQQIIADIQAECRAMQLPEPTPAHLRTALEIATNLPDRIITRAISEPANPTPYEKPTKTAPRTVDQVAGDDSPYTINQSLRLSAQQPPEAAPPPAYHPGQDRSQHRTR